MQGYNIFLEKRAQAQLSRLDKDTRSRIPEALHILRDEGFSLRLDLKKLKGYKDHYRLRIGRYRAI